MGVESKLLFLVLCILAHELGHCMSAIIFNIPIREVGINILGPYIKRARTKGLPEVITCLSGIMVNVLLACIFFHTNNWFFLCNFTFAWVNLIPMKNSDGTHALEAMGLK